MAGFYEMAVSFIDRSNPEQATSRNMGMLRWKADAPEDSPEELAALDELTVELMRAFVEDHDARLAKAKERIAARVRP